MLLRRLPPRALLFDFDGTLAPTGHLVQLTLFTTADIAPPDPIHFQAWRMTMERLGLGRELLWDEFHTVFSGKMNEDVIPCV